MWAQQQKLGSKSGFTLVELIIVVAVIAVLVVISAVVYSGVQRNAIEVSLQSDLKAVAGEVTRYGVNHNGTYGSAVRWYSRGAQNSNINFTPSDDNIIDIVASTNNYCIRAFNDAASKNTLENAYTEDGGTGACIALQPSVAAGGNDQNSLIGWWKLNNDTLDSSGNNNHGVAVTGATPAANRENIANMAYSFTGSGSSAITVANTFSVTANNFTVSAWFKISTAGDRKIISFSTTNPLQIFTAGQLRSCVSACTAGGSSVADGEWKFAATVGDATSTRTYLNGSSTPVITQAASSISLGSNVRIGRDISTGGFAFTGSIDDVRVYNTPATVEELADLYSAGPQ
jgi:prepilin-type N-terminal cleavage/methylation domain-containing protein